jgi:hypothetical protein
MTTTSYEKNIYDVQFELDKQVISKVWKDISNQLTEDLNNMAVKKSISNCALYIPSEYSTLNKRTNGFYRICNELQISPKELRTKIIQPLKKYHRQINLTTSEKLLQSIYNFFQY